MNPLTILFLSIWEKISAYNIIAIQQANQIAIQHKFPWITTTPVAASALPNVLPTVSQSNNPFCQYYNIFIVNIIQNPFIMGHQNTLMFIFALIPSIILPVPKTEVLFPLLAQGGDAFSLFIVATAGNIISEFAIYFISRIGITFALKKEEEEEGTIQDFLKHKYGMIIFFLSPFTFVGADALCLYAGLNRMSFIKFFPMLAAGFIFKNFIWLLLIENGILIFPSTSVFCKEIGG